MCATEEETNEANKIANDLYTSLKNHLHPEIL